MEELTCRYCDEILTRKDFCNVCEKPQKDSSQIIFTDKTCVRCYKTGYVVLDAISPYCIDCRIDITSKDSEVEQKREEKIDSQIHAKLNYSWLQSWFKWSYRDGNLTFRWSEPEFSQNHPPEIDKYKIYGEIIPTKIIPSNKQVYRVALESGVSDTVYLAAKIKGGGWLASKGSIYTLKTKIKT